MGYEWRRDITLQALLNKLKLLNLFSAYCRAEVAAARTSLASRTVFEVLGLDLGLEGSSSWPWPRTLQVLENCPVLGRGLQLFASV